MSVDTVGTLLASIANHLNDGLRILMFADKRQWGPDEFEQVRALEESLDEAKSDFQTLSPLVNGQFYYENDRTRESLEELRALNTKLEFHTQNFKDWLRTGGPINPSWALETVGLRRELHRAQCRAACRMYATAPGAARCLGGFLVRRRQRELEAAAQRKAQAASAGEDPDPERGLGLLPVDEADTDADGRRRMSLEALVPDCNAVGRFERFGDRDIAFTCDYCDGFLVWEDLQSMPSTRLPPPANPPSTTVRHGGGSPTTKPSASATTLPTSATTPRRADTLDSMAGHLMVLPEPTRPTSSSSAVSGIGHFAGLDHPNWQATARAVSTGETKGVVFAPLAIANHLLPANGDWRSRILCPYCDELTYFDDDGGGLELRYAQDEGGIEDVRGFQEHLEWYHTGMSMPSMPTKKTNCVVM